MRCSSEEEGPVCSSYECDEAVVRELLCTHSQELEGFEALARDHRHLLHFAEEADFVGREPGWKREGHGCCLCILWHCLCKFPMSLSLNGSCWLHSKNSGLAWDAPAPR